MRQRQSTYDFLLLHRITAHICGQTFFNGTIWSILIFYLPLYFELVKGIGIVEAGALLLPLLVTMTPFILFSVWIMDRLNGCYKELNILGFALLSIALGLLSTVKTTTSIAHVVGYMVMVAVGNAFTLQTSIIGYISSCL